MFLGDVTIYRNLLDYVLIMGLIIGKVCRILPILRQTIDWALVVPRMALVHRMGSGAQNGSQMAFGGPF